MSVLASYFNLGINQNSPVSDVYILALRETEDGTELVPQKVDYPAIQQSHGTVDDWSIDNLIKAGIDPASMHISTGYATRLDGLNDLSAFESAADAIFNDSSETSKTNE